MTSPDDHGVDFVPDHGPAAGCNYRQCGLADPFNCPFVKDEPEPSDVIDLSDLDFGTSDKKDDHEHQHTIPVEWEWEKSISWNISIPKRWSVTKLRCVCGDEIERKPTTT